MLPIVLFAAYRIGSRALKNNLLRGITALAFLAVFVFNVSFPYIVLTAGLIGFAGASIAPDKFQSQASSPSGDCLSDWSLRFGRTRLYLVLFLIELI